MKLFLIIVLLVGLIILRIWLFLMKKLKPERHYSDETLFEANKREGGYKVLAYFLIIGLLITCGIGMCFL